jgi:hypothetical protein
MTILSPPAGKNPILEGFRGRFWGVFLLILGVKNAHFPTPAISPGAKKGSKNSKNPPKPPKSKGNPLKTRKIAFWQKNRWI